MNGENLKLIGLGLGIILVIIPEPTTTATGVAIVGACALSLGWLGND